MTLKALGKRAAPVIVIFLMAVGTTFAAGPSAHPSHPTKGPDVTESEAPETEAPETEAPESDAPETEAPESEAPESEAPESVSPEANTASDVSAAGSSICRCRWPRRRQPKPPTRPLEPIVARRRLNQKWGRSR